MKLSKEEFELVVRHTPLVSIDFVIKNHENQCLLGLRKNAPAAGFWFNLGGRIYKNEIIDEALDRICLLYTSPSPRDRTRSRMPSSA